MPSLIVSVKTEYAKINMFGFDVVWQDRDFEYEGFKVLFPMETLLVQLQDGEQGHLVVGGFIGQDQEVEIVGQLVQLDFKFTGEPHDVVMNSGKAEAFDESGRPANIEVNITDYLAPKGKVSFFWKWVE